MVRIGITTRIETAATVKTVTIRYRFKAKVNRFMTVTKLDKMKPMMAVATLIPNQRLATRTRVEEIGTAATMENETTKDRMVVVVMVMMVVEVEEKVAAGAAVAGIK